MIARERIGIMVLCAVVAWFYTWTTRSSGDPWNFGAEQGDYYNLLIDGWLDGQLHMKVDAPEALLRAPNPYDPGQRPPGGLHDASFYHGKYFLYFGAAPVVTLMLPFRVLTGADLPMPAAILVFTLGGFVASALLGWLVQRRYFPDASGWIGALGGLTLGTASMGPSIVRRANIWELPLSSGYFFAMAALLALYGSIHAEKRHRGWLALASLALGLAVASRPTYLVAVPALLAPVAWRGRNMRWRERAGLAAAAIGPLAAVGLALAAHNYARFGNPLEFGTKYMLGGANEATARYFSADYFAYNVDRYFLRSAEWLRYFPFIFQPAAGAVPPGYYGVEEVYGALGGFFVLWLAPFAWLALWRRDTDERRRFGAFLAAILLLAAGPTIFLCCFWAAMARYQIDFLPALTLLGCLGVLGVERWSRTRPRGARALLRAALGGALAISIFFGVVQSLALYGNLRRLNPRAFARVARMFNTPIFLWEKLTQAPRGPLRIELKLAPRPAGTREPLVSTGLQGRADRVLVRYDGDDRVSWGCLHDGGLERWSVPARVDFEKTHTLRVEMGSLYPPEEYPFSAGRESGRMRLRTARWWRVELDGALRVESHQRFHPSSPATVRIGAEIPPRTGESKFSGKILRAARTPPALPSIPSPAEPALASEPFDAVRMTVTLPVGKTGAREPLVSAGDAGRGDFVFLEYLEGGRVRFGFDHWGKATRWSEPVPFRAGEPRLLEITLGSFGDAAPVREAVGALRVRLDGTTVWEFATKLYPIEPEEVFVGYNPIGGTSSPPSFRGAISWEWVRRKRMIEP